MILPALKDLRDKYPDGDISFDIEVAYYLGFTQSLKALQRRMKDDPDTRTDLHIADLQSIADEQMTLELGG